MPFIKIYIHFVWTTKNKKPLLDTSQLRLKVWTHMREYARSQGIFIDTINGYKDHCHCLISLGNNQAVGKILQLIKGESSHWINKNQLSKERFQWQHEYFASSVSESAIDKVRNYIINQDAHHEPNTFEYEYNRWIAQYGFQNDME